jgi:tetratricopeptide (TPR) repeat protein
MNLIYEKWDEILEYMRTDLEMTTLSFNTWIKPLKIHSLENNILRILVEMDGAVEYLEKAYALLPDNYNLLVDFARTLIAAKRYDRWIEVYETELPAHLKHGRLQMNAALCAAEGETPEKAVKYLTENFLMPDFEEGEFSLFAIWKRAHARIMERDGIKDPTEQQILEKYPLPFELDFRMH